MILTIAEYEQMLQFSAQIAKPACSIRTAILENLSVYFGYDEAIFWHVDRSGHLQDPEAYLLCEQALFDYQEKYYQYDFLHPQKNFDLYQRKKAIRLADIIDTELYLQSPYYQFMDSYGYFDELVLALTYKGTMIGIIRIPQKIGKRPFSKKDCLRLQYLSDIITSCLLHQLRLDHIYPLLSKREAEVAKLVKEGYTNQGIADRLFISANTVKKHLQNIYQKYNVRNRTQLVQLL
ncbi:LuxR C-terminal-related transcriptional regulator [Siminovitchia sediminis]|uniref:LuxR C-terminal-related transcriptional regulator n=1 Tax=Siminovitchia sediminis TaxID=1274353 RepID=A0ABW4KEW6_9BACI